MNRVPSLRVGLTLNEAGRILVSDVEHGSTDAPIGAVPADAATRLTRYGRATVVLLNTNL
jgi:hypothetical protein